MLNRRSLVAIAAAALLAAAPAFAQFQDRTIKFTNGVNEDHPVGLGVKKMQEVLAAKTGGKMKINAFWGGAAGGDLQATQALRAGTQEMVCTSSSPLVGIVKELGVFDLPFLFGNEKEADAVLDGDAGKYFNKKLEDAGLVNLAYWENGFRNLTNSKQAGGQGRGLRRHQGAGDAEQHLPGHLQDAGHQRRADGLRRGLHRAGDQDHRRPGKSLRDHRDLEVQRGAEVPVGHPPRLHAVPDPLQQEAVGPAHPQEQAVLREAAIEGQKVERAANRDLNAKSLASLKAKGMQVNEMAPAEQKRMFEKVRPVYDKNVPTIGAEAVNVVLDGLKKARGG
jgi:TRAP-type C4-dicarboxylate transport system substrate-binding protein